MPQCATCGNEDFTVSQGTYFCSICQTASQDIRLQETEVAFGTSQNWQLKVQTKEATTKSKLKNFDFGPSWTTTDAFNIIIKKLVDKLIELGVSSHVRDIIKNLWFKYLQETQYAFCVRKDGKEWTPKLPTFARERDIQVMYKGKTELTALKFQRSMKHIKRKRARRRYLKQTLRANLEGSKSKRKRADKSEIITDIAQEEVDAGDAPLNEVQNAGSKKSKKVSAKPYVRLQTMINTREQAIVNKLKQQYESKYAKSDDLSTLDVQKKVKRELKEISKDVKALTIERMTMNRVFDFLYLGVLLGEQSILLCDLLRWVANNSLPLRSAANLLPKSMTFQTYDSTTFRLIGLSHESIRSEVTKLAKMLDVAVIPAKNHLEIVTRFVLELNLPYEMVQLVNRLINHFPPKMTCLPTARKIVNWAPNYEGRALAYIVVVFKLLFGLDGKTEIKQAKFARKLKTILEDVNPFIWDNWYTFTSGRAAMLQMHATETSAQKPCELVNVDDVVQHYLSVETRLNGKSVDLKPFKLAQYRDSIRNPIREPLKGLCEGLAQIRSYVPDPPSSFPYTSKTKTILSNLGMEMPEITQTDFSRTTLEPFVMPESLRKRLLMKNYKLIVKYDNAWEQGKKQKSDTCLEEPMTKTEHMIKEESCSDQDIEIVESSFEQANEFEEDLFCGSQDLFSSKSVKPVAELTVYQPANSYVQLHYRKTKRDMYSVVSAKFSPALKWLMEILARMGEMKESTLYLEVILIERVLMHKPFNNFYEQNAFNLHLKHLW